MTIQDKISAGETAPAAGEQKADLNSYQQELQEDFSMPALPPEQTAEAEPAPKEDPQELNFRKLTEEVDRIKAERETERKEFQNQLDMLRANTAPRQADPGPKKMFDHMQDGDIPSVAEIRREWDQREANYSAQIEELKVASAHPDYAEVLQKYAAPLMKEKPHLLRGILSAENKAQALYELGDMQRQLQTLKAAPAPTQQSKDAQKIVENSRKPGNSAQMGGQSALSQVDYYATMSDADFIKFASRHLE